MKYVVCHEKTIERIEKRCREVLDRARETMGLPHIAIGFVNRSFRWYFPAGLTFLARTIETRADEGLIGRAFNDDRILIYPDDPRSAESFIRVSTTTVREVAAPIYYAGQRTGVVFADIQKGEDAAHVDSEALRETIKQCTNTVSDLLNEQVAYVDDLKRRLYSLVERCRSETGSKRGYIAVKKIDGDLEYLWERDEQVFLNLSQTEGLCGLVFRRPMLLNEGRVWTNPAYVSSDQEILSELIVPVVVKDETLAILNLERTKIGKYPQEMVDLVVKEVREAEEDILTYREMTGSGGPLSDLTQEVLHYSVEPDFYRFSRFLGGRLVRALHAERYVSWLKDATRPLELQGLEWNIRAPAGILSLPEGKGLIHAPIRTYGDLKCIVGVVTSTQPSVDDLNSVEQVCRIAGEVIEMKRQEWNSGQFESLIRRILLQPDSRTLMAAVTILSEIVSADHCTIFGKGQYGTKEFLAVVASTSRSIFKKSSAEMYYRLGEPFDGLTGRVGTTGKPIDFSDLEQELPELAMEGKKGMSEEGDKDTEIAAFSCRPIFAPEGELIGVLRLYRAKTRGQLGDFATKDKERLALLCEILGRSYGNAGFLGSTQEVAELQHRKSQ